MYDYQRKNALMGWDSSVTGRFKNIKAFRHFGGGDRAIKKHFKTLVVGVWIQKANVDLEWNGILGLLALCHVCGLAIS